MHSKLFIVILMPWFTSSVNVMHYILHYICIQNILSFATKLENFRYMVAHGGTYVIILSPFILSLKDLMTFFLKVTDNEKWQAVFSKMLVYEEMTIISWTQYLKRRWFISSTKHEMFFHLLIHPNMAAVISRFDKYVEIWIEHKRKTCIDGY